MKTKTSRVADVARGDSDTYYEWNSDNRDELSIRAISQFGPRCSHLRDKLHFMVSNAKVMSELEDLYDPANTEIQQ